jgi:hypothetical protein
MEGATTVALLTVQAVVAVPSADLTFSAVAASDTIPWDSRLAAVVLNGGGTVDTVTVLVPGNGPGGVAYADPTFTVPITTGRRFFFLGDPAYMDPTTGLITITHSFTTTVTIAVFRY